MASSPSLFLALLLALTLRLVSAQDTVSVSTTIALTVETVVPLAPGPGVNPGGPIRNVTCTLDTLSCPECSGANVTDSNGARYEAYCDSYISSSAISRQPTLLQPSECLLACDGFFGCSGAYITDDGNCTLTIGELFGTLELDGITAFVSIGDILEIVGNSTSSSVSGLPTGAPTPIATQAPYANVTTTTTLAISVLLVTSAPPLNATWPYANVSTYNATAPYPTPYNGLGSGTAAFGISTESVYPFYPNTTSSSNATVSSDTSCSIKRLTCPACDGQAINDSHDVSYTVLCDTSLTSSSQYALAEPLHASYCMAECDERNATCVGAYWINEECTLALGTYKDTIANPGYTAFLRQAAAWPTYTSLPVPVPTTVPTWLNMSMYNTGPYGTTPTAAPGTAFSTISSSYAWTETVTSTYAGFLPAPTCDPQAIGCPECDGLAIVDGLNEAYRVQCNFAPSCDNTLGIYGSYSLNMCMERCDADATCLAAIYNDRHCDLCQRGMEGTYDDSADYLVLIPQTIDVSTAVSLTATVSSLSSVLATTFSSLGSITFAPVTVSTASSVSIHLAPGLPSPLPTVRTSVLGPIFTPSISIPASSQDASSPTSPARFVSCPDSDHDAFQAAAGDFVVSCNSILEADAQRYTPAEDIGTCADQCLDDCDGVQWEDDTADCLLLTSISVLDQPSTWTAAVRVWQAGTAAAVSALVTSSSALGAAVATLPTGAVSAAYSGPLPGLLPTFTSDSLTTAVSFTSISVVTNAPTAAPLTSTDLTGFTTSTTEQAAVSTDIPLDAGVPYTGPPRQHGYQHGAQHGIKPQGVPWFLWLAGRVPW